MQTIAQNGYTQQEVLDVLQFKSGSRQLTFRYELLDATNAKISDLTNVLDCTVYQAYLDDVKRTAKFTVEDDGSIDFQSDRIKPWVQVAMPADTRNFITVTGTYNNVQTGEYNLNEIVTAGGAVNAGLAGTGMNGTIGSAVTLGATPLAEGSAMVFPAVTGAPNRITITNGGRYVANVAGTGGFTVANEFGFTCFINQITNTSLGKVWQTSTGSAYLGVNADVISFVATTATGGTVNVTCRNPYGSDLKFIGVSRRVGIGTQIYVNGLPQTMTVITDDPSNVLTGGGDMYIAGDVNMSVRLDAVTWYNSGLSDASFLEIYRAGRQLGPFHQTNYVEWAQGVFILSAPVRAADANKVITRDVDGFDGEQQFIDDVVATRYTAAAGMTYVNNILGLVMSYVPTNLGIEDPTYWSNIAGNSTFPATGGPTVNLAGPTVTGSQNYYPSAQVFTVANMDYRINASLPTSGAGGRQIYSEIGADDGTNFVLFGIVYQSSIHQWCIFAASGQGGALITSTTLVYDSVAMKYLRVWENMGTIYYQSSPDQVTWLTLTTTPSWSYLSKVAVGPILGVTTADSAWSVTFNLTVSAALQRPVNIGSSMSVVPVAKDYDPGTTKLAIINDLLGAINYNSLYFDANGVPQLTPYISPSTRAPEYVYADDDASVTLPEKSETFDTFSVPNEFVLVVSNPDGTSLTSVYTNDNPESPTSTVSRGRTIVYYELELDAPDQATLDAKALALANNASQPYDEIDFTTAIMPFHASNDVYGIVYSDLGILDKYSETKWSFQLKEGATMSHTARRQVQI